MSLLLNASLEDGPVEVPSCEEMILCERVEISLDIFYHYSKGLLYSELSLNPGNTWPLTEETDHV